MYIKTFESFKDIHSICEKYGIKNYTINLDGSINVNGNVSLVNKGLTKIPLKFKEVSGGFYCSYNNLTTLEFSPKRVGGGFWCSYNNLTTLEFSPKRVGGDFYCQNNDIWTFEDFNTIIGGSFICYGSPIWEIWKLFVNTKKLELLNEIDAIRPRRIVIMDRLNEFLIMIGKEPVQKIEGYKCI